jgi:bacterioferritin
MQAHPDGSSSMEPRERKIDGNVQGMIDRDLALEISAVRQYNASVQVRTDEKDDGSRDLLAQLLKDEEDHVDWLGAQVHQIKELGYERHLTMPMGEEE